MAQHVLGILLGYVFILACVTFVMGGFAIMSEQSYVLELKRRLLYFAVLSMMGVGFEALSLLAFRL